MDIRAFLAFELPEEMKVAVHVAAEKMKEFPLDVRWVKPENVHLTLIFLGNMESGRLDSMSRAIATVCQNHGPFNMRVRGTGTFGSRGRPGVIWAGMHGDVNKMAGFRDALQEDLGAFGIKREHRSFRPHLTIGRFRKRGRPGGRAVHEALSSSRDVNSPVCLLDRLLLFRSELKPGGAEHTVIKTWLLGGMASKTI